MTPNGPFYLSQPEPGDDRPRNAFGILIGFGQAYSEYYRRRDTMNAESAQLDNALIAQKAQALWQSLTLSEQKLVRFGMFSVAKMEAADAKLIMAGIELRDVGRLLAVALMDIAERMAE